MEDIAYLLRIPQRKPWGNMAADVDASLAALANNRAALLKGVPADKAADGEALLNSLFEALKRLQLAVQTQQPDAVSVRVATALKAVMDLELLQVRLSL